MNEIKHISRPAKQSRSREKIEKTLATVAKLMQEYGDDSFTLHDVSREAGVSLSSIYGRVNGKAELIRAVQEQVLTGMEPGYEAYIRRYEGRSEPLAELLPDLIEDWAELMNAHAPMLRPIMWVARTYPEVSARGRVSYQARKAVFVDFLLAHKDEIRASDPEVAADTLYTILYSTVARHLGFGTAMEAAGEGDWDTIKRELGRIAVSYLTKA